ncbi:LAMI_0F04258g1_1 [Lachancea mirantina]|uniref:Trimethylguanosine synthase n=1 Tax=Lachancea mirantina TaxID=1230905 RepID=A0A1G4JXP9_9SACH|nr:LAMI_0F04258g1_1 [Lachancea mirantina]
MDQVDLGRFVHLTKHKYRKQLKELKRLVREDAFRVDESTKVSDKSVYKYWTQRKSIFSVFGGKPLYLTRELWFSITPEAVARFTAQFIRSCLPQATTVLDVFCGGGGNLIQFAMFFPTVYGVDFSMEHLYCAYRNAKAYDVEDRIWLKYGDWNRLARKGRFEKLGVDCVFASPPWGGPNYLKRAVFDVETQLEPLGLREMLKGFLRVSSNVAMFLPRNSNLSQISQITRELLGEGAKCKVLYVKIGPYLKGILCLWGEPFYDYQCAAVDEEVPAPKEELDY